MTDEIRPLDQHVKLLADMKECQDMVSFWEDRLKSIKGKLAEIMGDATVGTVNGEEVFFYKPVERFRGSDFRREYPDMYRFFTRDVMHKEFDLDWFKAQRPDLYEQFQVRSMRSLWGE